jgi:hypothetical protein
VLPAVDVAFAWHDWHTDADAPENVLIGHETQVAAKVAPMLVE